MKRRLSGELSAAAAALFLVFTLVFGIAARAATEFMVAAANPHAVKAGYDVLSTGGTAADAAVAVQMVLNLVEPQSSGIGGGAFILYWDAKARTLHTVDGRETAPAAATPERFLTAEGKKEGYWQAAVGGQSVGVPGTLKALDILHRLFGQRRWKELFAPAIILASEGFEVSPRLAESVARAKYLDRFDATRAYFFPGGQPLAAGTRLTNAAFARTLREIAEGGAEVFYNGPIAEDIVAAVNATSAKANNITRADIASYRAKLRPPVCLDYRAYEVCGMGPPTSGGLTVGQVLGMLSHFDLAKMGWSAELAHVLGEAEKLAYADRAMYIADSDYVAVPAKGLLDTAYLAKRAALIDTGKAGAKAPAGVPPGAPAVKLAASRYMGHLGTSHFVIRDAAGNAVSMTTTIESGFGSRVLVRGFLLNNELTDFDREPTRDGRLVANRVEGGKRPRSSMSPTIVFADDVPYLLVGSPGGSRIPGYVVKTLIAVLDLGMDPQAAIDLGHVAHRNTADFDIEIDSGAQAFGPVLAAKGHQVKARRLTSGLHAIRIDAAGRMSGGADGRREGTVMGR
ncbi:MAG: gamma-glutamyltransferase [Gammaproteobacteria bacterium]|nr:gamma-glutamyltransferase [Gammaproteobacteria bacterium]